MGGLVQLACKKVKKYDLYHNEICEYDSVKDCMNLENISDFVLRKCSKENKLYNNFYFKIIDNESHYVKAICDNCGVIFQCERWRVNSREHLFCTKKCEGAWRKKQSPLNCTCEYCGKKFHRSESHISYNIKNYCSYECANNDKKIRYSGNGNHQHGLKGKNNASWKSDERISFYGYKLIRKLDHPFKNCDDFVFEHRLVAEEFLLNDLNSIKINRKKYLKKEYVVHHLDFNRLNNNVDNLLVMTRSDHTALHTSLNTEESFKNYCNKYSLDFEEVYNNHLYNLDNYKYVGA